MPLSNQTVELAALLTDAVNDFLEACDNDMFVGTDVCSTRRPESITTQEWDNKAAGTAEDRAQRAVWLLDAMLRSVQIDTKKMEWCGLTALSQIIGATKAM